MKREHEDHLQVQGYLSVDLPLRVTFEFLFWWSLYFLLLPLLVSLSISFPLSCRMIVKRNVLPAGQVLHTFARVKKEGITISLLLFLTRILWEKWRVMREEEWGKKNRSRVSTRRGKHPRTDIFFGQKRGKGGNSYPWNRSHRIKTKREGKKDEDISVRRDRRSVTDGILFETGIRTWTNVEDGLINWWLGWYRMWERLRGRGKRYRGYVVKILSGKYNIWPSKCEREREKKMVQNKVITCVKRRRRLCLCEKERGIRRRRRDSRQILLQKSQQEDESPSVLLGVIFFSFCVHRICLCVYCFLTLPSSSV